MIYKYILCIFFALWFIATILVQLRKNKCTDFIKSRDRLSLLPLWTFFAPNPGVNDYHLLYREEDAEGLRSAWEEVALNENRKLLTSIWNPAKRGKKVLSDVIQNVVPMIEEYHERPKVIMFSLPYLLILNAVMKEQQLLQAPTKKQFLLAASDGYGSAIEPQMILISEFHPIH